MPSGKPINWSEYDALLILHLPTCTIEQWRTTYASHISAKAIGVRAKYLGVSPIKYRPTAIHKQKIASSITKIGQYELARIIELRDAHSIVQIAAMLGLDSLTVQRAITKHKIALSTTGKKRARLASNRACVGRDPWNKGGELSAITKERISIATTGEKNSQFGKGMTTADKIKWRASYNSHGIDNMRSWILSDAGQAALRKMVAVTTSPEFRQSCSERASQAVLNGAIKTNRGHGSHLCTVKGGSFYTKSTYETRYVAILEADPLVVRFFYEPLRIPYEFEGAQLYYIPDFLVAYSDGHEELVEVKPECMVTWPKNAAKINAGSKYHTCFRVITEEDLNVGYVDHLANSLGQ